MKKVIAFMLFFMALISCKESINQVNPGFNNPVVWEESQASADKIYNGIEYILKAFGQYDIVAIGEQHGIAEVTDFYIELIKNEEFRNKVDVVVSEFGNSLYQDVLDDFILGINKDTTQISKLWRDHSSSFLQNGDRAGVKRLFKEVRDANVNSDHKIRILGGEPPIDWSKIKCLEELFVFVGQRDKFYTNLVLSEVLNKKKKALLIMGSAHFTKREEYKQEKPITSLHKRSGENLVLINTLTSDVFPFIKLPEMAKGELIETINPIVGKLQLDAPFIEKFPLDTQTDALLYLGDINDLVTEENTPFNDPLYEAELSRRKNLTEKCK